MAERYIEPHSEKDLLARLADGDDSAFDVLFRAYWDHVYSVALLMTKSPDMAEDIGQEVFLGLLKDRTRMAAIENLKGFLYTSVKFMVHKRLRRLSVEEAYAQYISAQFMPGQSVAYAEAAIRLKEIQQSLREGIEKLPVQQRRAFQLSREQGLSHEQISVKMGVSKKTVKDYIVRALAFLRQYLKQYGGMALLYLLTGCPF
jgi:RNA polymerase sigma-70 factor (family 1)